MLMAQVDHANKRVTHPVQAKDGSANHVATVGGPLTDNWYPYLEWGFWGEDTLAIDLTNELPGQWETVVNDVTGRVTLYNPTQAAPDFIIDIHLEESVLKMDIVLNRKPPGNKNAWSINLIGWENYNFLQQEDYSQFPGALSVTTPDGDRGWQIDEDGHIGIRAESMCGGYDVYHKTKRNHILGQTNYYTGMVCAIPRPLFTDNLGDAQYGSVTFTDGVLTLFSPSSQWMNQANYPVRIT